MFLLKKYAALVIVLVFYLILSISSLLDNPPVWPDEAYYADTALNLLTEDRLGTDLWGDMVPGARTNLYFYPPGLFYLFAGLYSFTGQSIYYQRLLTVITGAGFLVAFYFLGRKVVDFKGGKTKESIFILLAVLLLIIDNLFLRASRWSRPEIFVLFFSYLSIFLLFAAEDSNYKRRNYLFAMAGLFLAIGLLFHFFAVIYVLAFGAYFLFKYRLKVIKSPETYYFFLPIIFVFGAWILSISSNINFLFTQVGLQKIYRELSPNYLMMVFHYESIYLKIYFGVMLLISVVSILFGFLKKNLRLWFIVLILLFSWVYLFVGKIEAYSVLIVPLNYLFLILMFKALFDKGKQKYFGLKMLCVSAIALLLIINLYIYVENLSKTLGGYKNYRVFNENLKGKIPQGSNIYLTSLPDAYFLVRESVKGKIYTFPALSASKEEYIKVLNDSDYLIYNFNPGGMFFGNYLDEYLKLNTQEVMPIGLEDEHRFLIIKLVDKNLRKSASESSQILQNR